MTKGVMSDQLIPSLEDCHLRLLIVTDPEVAVVAKTPSAGTNWEPGATAPGPVIVGAVV